MFESINGEKGCKRVRAAFAHKKGGGLTLLIDGKRYAAFPPKAKTISVLREEMRETDWAGPQVADVEPRTHPTT